MSETLPTLRVQPSSRLLRSEITPGHSKYMRILVFGGAGGGKSFFLASMPGPILAASGGNENGISLYLNATRGDRCFEVQTADDLKEFLKFALANMDFFKSIVFDPITAIWEDYMDGWNKELGGEIRGGKWQVVKAPWKLFMRQLKASKLHVGMSAWVNDIVYEEVEEQPGVKKLSIKSQEVPKAEKRIPHHIDMILMCNVIRDKKNSPTFMHEVVVHKARRPKTIDPTELHVGKKWKFDSRKPISPWDTVIAPMLERWGDGAIEPIGFDPVELAEDAEDKRETDVIVSNQAMALILRRISEAKDFVEYRNETWPKIIEPFLNNLRDPQAREIVMKAHEDKKTELIKKA